LIVAFNKVVRERDAAQAELRAIRDWYEESPMKEWPE
jgi:hypothetical protein